MPDLLQINENMLVPRDKISSLIKKTKNGKEKLYAMIDGGIYVIEEAKLFMEAYNRQPKGTDSFHFAG